MVNTMAKHWIDPVVNTHNEIEANKVVIVVMIERLNVPDRDALMMSVKFFVCIVLMFSRIRSRITTVALIE